MFAIRSAGSEDRDAIWSMIQPIIELRTRARCRVRWRARMRCLPIGFPRATKAFWQRR